MPYTETTIAYLTNSYLAGDVDDDGIIARLLDMGIFDVEAWAILGCMQDDALHLRMSRLIDGMEDAA